MLHLPTDHQIRNVIWFDTVIRTKTKYTQRDTHGIRSRDVHCVVVSTVYGSLGITYNWRGRQ